MWVSSRWLLSFSIKTCVGFCQFLLLSIANYPKCILSSLRSRIDLFTKKSWFLLLKVSFWWNVSFLNQGNQNQTTFRRNWISLVLMTLNDLLQISWIKTDWGKEPQPPNSWSIVPSHYVLSVSSYGSHLLHTNYREPWFKIKHVSIQTKANLADLENLALMEMGLFL